MKSGKKLLFMTAYQVGQREKNGHFLSRQDVNNILESSEGFVEVTDDFAISDPTTVQDDENSAILPLMIVFAMLFSFLAAANAVYFFYFKRR